MLAGVVGDGFGGDLAEGLGDADLGINLLLQLLAVPCFGERTGGVAVGGDAGGEACYRGFAVFAGELVLFGVVGDGDVASGDAG